jgi:hypothetical protein
MAPSTEAESPGSLLPVAVLLKRRRHRAVPGELDVRLPQLVDDLLGLESLAWHDLTS